MLFRLLLSDSFNLCILKQDKIEMVEDIEYENQIHCKVQMQKSCQFINSPATSEDQVSISTTNIVDSKKLDRLQNKNI